MCVRMSAEPLEAPFCSLWYLIISFLVPSALASAALAARLCWVPCWGGPGAAPRAVCQPASSLLVFYADCI